MGDTVRVPLDPESTRFAEVPEEALYAKGWHRNVEDCDHDECLSPGDCPEDLLCNPHADLWRAKDRLPKLQHEKNGTKA